MKKFYTIQAVSITLILLILGYIVYVNQGVAKQVNLRMHYKLTGLASWYSKGKLRSGDDFEGKLLSCASQYFPRYSLLMVRNKTNGKKIIVWQNDIHEATDIIIDLSKSAYRKIATLDSGKVIVEVTYLGILKKPNPYIFGKKIDYRDLEK